MTLTAGCQRAVRFPIDPLSGDPRLADAEVVYDTDGDGQADYKQGCINGVKRHLAFDQDGDGVYELEFDKSSTVGSPIRHVVLKIDGVPYPMMEELYAEGRFRMFRSPGRVIGRFPSLPDSSVAPTITGQAPSTHGIHATGPSERRDNSGSDAIPNARWTRSQAGWGWLDRLLLHFAPEYVLSRELAKTRRRLERTQEQEVTARLASLAWLSQHAAWDEAKDQLRVVDRWVEQLVYDYRGKIEVTLYGGCGSTYRGVRRLSLSSILEAAGLHVTESPDSELEVRVPSLDPRGPLNFAAVYASSNRMTERVASILRETDGIELVLTRDASPDKVHVYTRAGEAWIQRRSDGTGGVMEYRYQPVIGDPLELMPTVARLATKHRLDTDGYASAPAWLEMTWTHVFPDPLRRIWEGLSEASSEASSEQVLLVSLADGWYTGRSPWGPPAKRTGARGGLRDTSSISAFLSTAITAPDYMRHQEIGAMVRREITSRSNLPAVATAQRMGRPRWESEPAQANHAMALPEIEP